MVNGGVTKKKNNYFEVVEFMIIFYSGKKEITKSTWNNFVSSNEIRKKKLIE